MLLITIVKPALSCMEIVRLSVLCMVPCLRRDSMTFGQQCEYYAMFAIMPMLSFGAGTLPCTVYLLSVHVFVFLAPKMLQVACICTAWTVSIYYGVFSFECHLHVRVEQLYFPCHLRSENPAIA